MNCRHARRKMIPYADGEPVDGNELRAHLDGCAACRRELEELAGREPGNSEVWELLGHVCMREKRYDLAGRAYRRAMQTGTESGELENLIEICSLKMQSPGQPTLESPAVSSASSPGEDQIYPGDD